MAQDSESDSRLKAYPLQLLSVAGAVLRERMVLSKPVNQTKSNVQNKKPPWYRKVAEIAKRIVSLVKFIIYCLFRKGHVPISAARRIIDCLPDHEAGSSRGSEFSKRLQLWICLNFGLFLFDDYAKKCNYKEENVKRGLLLSVQLMRDCLLCKGKPEVSFLSIYRFGTDAATEIDWKYFDDLHGGIFTDDVRKVLTDILQFDRGSASVLVDCYRKLLDKLSDSEREIVQEIKVRFLRNTGWQGFVDIVGREVRNHLAIYCDWMRELALKNHDKAAVQKCGYAAQAVDELRAKVSMPENDAEIERLVSEIVRRVNEAGSYIFALRQVNAASIQVESSVNIEPKDTDLSSKGQYPLVKKKVSPRLRKGFIKSVDFEQRIIRFKEPEEISGNREMIINQTQTNAMWNLLERLLTQVDDDGWVTLTKEERGWHGLFRRTAPRDRSRTVIDPTQNAVILGFHIFPNKNPGEYGDTKIRLEKRIRGGEYKTCKDRYEKWCSEQGKSPTI